MFSLLKIVDLISLTCWWRYLETYIIKLYKTVGNNEYNASYTLFKYKIFWHKQSFQRYFGYGFTYHDIMMEILLVYHNVNFSLCTAKRKLK